MNRGKKTEMPRLIAALAGAAAMILPVGHATAQTFPSQPIRMVVPFAAGAVNDVLGRMAAEHLRQRTGQTVVVENRIGASGNLGLSQVAQSTPDGYTIAMAGVTNFAVNPLIFKTMPLDMTKDLVAVAPLAETPLVVTTNAKALPMATFQEFVAYARANPGKLNYGSAGAGTPSHILGDHILRQAGLSVAHVPYRGAAPAQTDLISGNVQLMFASPGSNVEHVAAGTLRFLAVASAERLPFLSKIPTTGESGLPKLTIVGWWGIVAPSATPRPILERLNALLNEMADTPAIRERTEKLYMVPLKMSLDQAAAQLKADLPVWARIVKDAGIQPE